MTKFISNQIFVVSKNRKYFFSDKFKDFIYFNNKSLKCDIISNINKFFFISFENRNQILVQFLSLFQR